MQGTKENIDIRERYLQIRFVLTIFIIAEDDIREHMVDIDCILTDEERKLVDESHESQKKGTLISLSEIKKEMGL